MQKIDYGDINKFLVSVGLVLIGIALLIPYFYLKEDFGLLVTAEKYNSLTDQIKIIFDSKVDLVSSYQTVFPWFSLGFLILGIIALIVGLCRWFGRQKQIDKKYDLDIKKLELEIEALTPEEKIKKAEQEVDEIELSSQIEANSNNIEIDHILPKNRNQQVLGYIKVEQDIINHFRNYRSPNFDILDNQRLGNRREVDLILKAKTKKFSDRLIEIKYFKRRMPIDILKKSIYQLSEYISYYNENVTKRVVPVLLIVYSSETNTPDAIKKYEQVIKEELVKFENLKRFKFAFIEDSKIFDFDIKTLLKK